jgi:TolB-like protein
LRSFFEELKRRNVFRVGAAYLVSAWLIIQLVETILPAFGFGDGAVRLVVIVLAIGLLPVLILAWAFELTAEGVKRDSDVDHSRPAAAVGRRVLNRALIALLIAALGFFAFDRFVLGPQRPAATAGAPETEAASEPESSTLPAATGAAARSVAVLPFVAMSSGEDDEYFADGLTEEILNSLAALSELLVTARTSAFHFKGADLPIPEIAATLGVAHVVEGSVRRAGERVRITAQLIRAADGFHLWSDTYDRTLEDVFAVQEDIAQSIAEVLNVVLDEDALARMRGAGIGDVDAFIAYQKGAEAFAAAHSDIANVSDALATANTWFDQVLAIAPQLTEVHLKRADLRGHLLFEIAAGYRAESYPGEGAAVTQALLGDYAHAWDSAPPGQDRAIVEVERTLFTDDWSGLAAKLDLALAGDQCAAGNWIGQLGDAYGRAERMVDWTRNSLRCDPLSGVATLSLIQALVWAGRAEEALQALDEAETLQQNVPFLRDLRIAALLAAGRYEDDPQAYLHGGHVSLYPFPDQFLLEAVAGDPQRAREIAADYLARPGVDDYSSLVAAAVVGDRASANAAAARIDQRTGGPFMLMEAIQMCMCGAPFDLDATTRFKARIEESGFPWPPPKPIDYPLKTW